MTETTDTAADTREAKVLAEAQRRARESLRHSGDWRTEAVSLYDQVAGRQWDPDDQTAMQEQQRPMVTFNLIAKFIDAVVGLQINNRQEVRAFPRELGDAVLSELDTAALAWQREQCDAEFEETDAGHDCLLHGMGWVETFLDEESQSEANVAKERRDPLEMLWDPTARKKNLIDRKWQMRLTRIGADDYKSRFGEDPSGDVGFGISTHDTELSDALQVINRPQDYEDPQAKGLSQPSGRPLVADYQWFELEDHVQYTAQLDGDQEPTPRLMHSRDWPVMEKKLQDAGVAYKTEPKRQRVYYRAWITSAGIKAGSIKVLAHGFNYEAITGKRDRNTNTWYGMGRALLDPQKWVNKFFSHILWVLSVTAKGGLMAERSAFDDVAKAEASWANPSKITWTEDGAVSNGKIMPKPAASYPQGMDRLMSFSLEALPQISGLNAELLGLVDRDQPGIVETQRKQGALAIIAWYFDALHRHYKSSGRLMLKMIRDFIADGRLIRVLGKEKAQYMPLLKDKMALEFDIIVDEAPTSVNMRERVGAVLVQIIPMALQAGIRVPPDVLDYLPIPTELAQKWKNALNPPPDQAQLAQRAAVADVADKEAGAAQKASAAELNKAKVAEIAAKTPVEVATMNAEAISTAAQAGSHMAGGNT